MRVFESVSCTDLVPIEEVSNGCGGEGVGTALLNWLGNEQEFRNSDINPFAADFTVRFKESCDAHDAGYEGVTTIEPTTGEVADFRSTSRRWVDDKFLKDLRAACHAQIHPFFEHAIDQCDNWGRPETPADGALRKSLIASAFGHYFLVADGEAEPEVYVAAVARGQAGIVFLLRLAGSVSTLAV